MSAVGSPWLPLCDGRGKDHPAFELKIPGERYVRTTITVIIGAGVRSSSSPNSRQAIPGGRLEL